MRRSHFRNGAVLLAATTMLALGACGQQAEAEAEDSTSEESSDAADAADSESASDAESDSAGALEANLATPEVDDVWAADLTQFSSASFNAGNTGGPSGRFGLLRVVDVTPEEITVITEMGAWPQSDGALSDLAGDMSDIQWDNAERIPVDRDDLAQLVEDGHILRTRRGAPVD